MPDGEQHGRSARAERRRREGGLRVLVADERGCPLPATGLTRWLRRVAPARARGTVNIALVSDARVRALNRAYRDLDAATDVLSFPAFARPVDARASARQARHVRPSALSPDPFALIAHPFLGDIVIARGVAARQAREARHSELTELRVLALHGLLHLLGYDHERDNGRMLRVERRLRRKGGLREGVIERARPSTRSLRSGQAGPGRANTRARASTHSTRAGQARSGRPFDKLRGSAGTARGEPFDSSLILSVSKDERRAQGRLVERRAPRR